MNSKLTSYVKNKFMLIAQDLLENPQGLKFKLEKAGEKLSRKNVVESLGVHVADLKLLIRMTKSWLSRKYNGVSKQTLMYTVLAVVYFVTPTDFVPDFILGLGFVDDIAVLSWVLGVIKEDLELYRNWEKEKNK